MRAAGLAEVWGGEPEGRRRRRLICKQARAGAEVETHCLQQWAGDSGRRRD